MAYVIGQAVRRGHVICVACAGALDQSKDIQLRKCAECREKFVFELGSAADFTPVPAALLTSILAPDPLDPADPAGTTNDGGGDGDDQIPALAPVFQSSVVHPGGGGGGNGEAGGGGGDDGGGSGGGGGKAAQLVRLICEMRDTIPGAKAGCRSLNPGETGMFSSGEPNICLHANMPLPNFAIICKFALIFN